MDKLINDASKYFESNNINYSRIENEIIIEFLEGDIDSVFRLIIHFTGHWISLTVCPFIMPIDNQYKSDYLLYIGRKNYDLKFIRLALTETLETVVCLDIPAEHFSEKLLIDSIDIIIYYANILYKDILTFLGI